MHESIKAREIEKTIKKMANLQGLKEISKVILMAGRANSESRENIIHILKERMKIDSFEVIEENVVLVCRKCGFVIDETEVLICPKCGSLKIDIAGGMGLKVLKVE